MGVNYNGKDWPILYLKFISHQYDFDKQNKAVSPRVSISVNSPGI